MVKDKGLTLEGARQALKSKKSEVEKRLELLERLQDLKKELLSIEEEFDRLHEQQKYSKTQPEN